MPKNWHTSRYILSVTNIMSSSERNEKVVQGKRATMYNQYLKRV